MLRKVLCAASAAVSIVIGPAVTFAGESSGIAPPGAVVLEPSSGGSTKSKLSLPTGLSYTLDASSATLLGNVGWPTKGLPGGFDAALSYGFNPHIRASAGYYTVQEFPAGFAQGTVPLYLQGLSAPIGSVNLSQNAINATTMDKIFVGEFQTLVRVGPIPLVIAPTYLSRTASVGGSDDSALVEINGFPQYVHTRTFEQQMVAFTLPFLASPKFFGTYTFGPQWNVNTSGANATNAAQIFQLLSLEYHATPQLRAFFQPALIKPYTPVDPYPQHLATLIYGASYAFAKPFFVQGYVSTGVPTNPIDPNRLGVVSITCQQLPCSPNQSAVQIGGLKSTQYVLQIGIGRPSVVPL
ncbi:MAG TPA: hypothetical protein VGZ00_12580 [Candidatus Baltobacteraceae bacterium]|jgi:hypothetical protein|nr:hypothetical protein [Candidatus Baltobacteraceae bacterium]